MANIELKIPELNHKQYTRLVDKINESVTRVQLHYEGGKGGTYGDPETHIPWLVSSIAKVEGHPPVYQDLVLNYIPPPEKPWNNDVLRFREEDRKEINRKEHEVLELIMSYMKME